MRENIRGSTSPKDLAARFPLPPLGPAPDAVRQSVERFCLLAGIEALTVMMEQDATARYCQSKSAWASGDVPFSVEKGEAGIAGFRGYAAFVMISMALLA